MSSWLRNIQGQLSEFASEVLNEATEEVSDPESELQVAKKKLSEAEKELSAEKENVGRLQKKIGNLEEELYAKNLELDALNAKCNGMVESRDNQIRTLQAELERIRHAEHRESLGDGDDDEGLFSEGSARIARMKDEMEQLRKEVAHWKRLVNEQPQQNAAQRISELERIVAEQKTKYENEVAALIAAHSETVAQMNSQNEENEEDRITTGNVTEGEGATSEIEESSVVCIESDKEEVKGVVQCIDQLNSENDSLKEQIQLLTEERDLLLSKIELVQEENAIEEDQVDRLTFEAVDKVLSERLKEMEQQCEGLQGQVDVAQEEINEKKSQLSQLQAEVEEAHNLIDVQREKFEHDIAEERERSKDRIEELQKEAEELRAQAESREKENKRSGEELKIMTGTVEKLNKELETWQKRVEISETIFEEQQTARDRELEKLRSENAELTAAYNDLNEEFENHKAAHGSVVISNRDLTARIDALKANLIEYEERYEMCKNENAETVQQLEKLSNDFERLRLSFENSKTKSASDAVDEVERLRTELDASKDDREKLRADVERFRSAIGLIDTELNRLRESNDRLVQDNKVMGANLDRFTEIRDMLENSDSELRSLREKFLQLQNEHELKEQEWREQLAELSEARDDAKRQLEECQRETAMRRMLSSGRTPSTEIVEIKSEGKATTSSEGTVDSNNGWEKMADWDATAAATLNDSATNGQNTSTVMDELREALAMVTEKTEECEELRRQKYELDKELDLRQTCIDELMAQMNVLQSQQHIHAETFTQLRDWGNELERDKLELERNLVRTEEKLKEVQEQLEGLKAEKEKDEELRTAMGADEVQQIKESYEQKISDQTTVYEEALRSSEEEHKCALEEVKNELESKLKMAEDEIMRLQEQYRIAQEESASKAETKESAELSQIKANLSEATQRQNELQKTNGELEQKLNETSAQLTEAERIRAELVTLVEQKHAESVNYHTQLQTLLTEREQQSSTFAASAERVNDLKQELKSCTEARDKALKECERLRDHLMNIEEASTREAVTAEERETELRQRIRVLEQKTEESADSVIESANAYQRQIAELNDELDLMKNEKVSIVERLREREKTLGDTKTALSNLQTVLRDIGVDHEAQVAQYESSIAELRKHIEELKLEVVQLKQAQDALVTEKQSLEDGTIHLKEEISRKDAMIEELEASLDDRAQAARASTSSHTIDDQVLRQIFLSYFTADKDKQPEIAVLLASVLGYSQEDIAKISAANQTAPRGWFGFGGSPRPPQQNISLAEQFVRFLEKESVTTPHSLPVQQPEEKETMRSSSVPLKPSRPSSTTDLRSILNT